MVWVMVCPVDVSVGWTGMWRHYSARELELVRFLGKHVSFYLFIEFADVFPTLRRCFLSGAGSDGRRLRSADSSCVWHRAPRRQRGVVPRAGPQQHPGLRDLPAGWSRESGMITNKCRFFWQNWCTFVLKETHSSNFNKVRIYPGAFMQKKRKRKKSCTAE